MVHAVIAAGSFTPLGTNLGSPLPACRAIACGVWLGSFRDGPIFPALLPGAGGGISAAHLPWFGLVSDLACGLAGMRAAMLRLPLSSAILVGPLLAGEGLSVDPLIAVAVAIVDIARSAPAVATGSPAVANQAQASTL